MEEPDYLSAEDEEINEDYTVPMPDEESEETITDVSGGDVTFSGEEDLVQAIGDLKDLVHEEFFQNGSREKVHNMSVLSDYVKFLGIIHDFTNYVFATKQPINMSLFQIGLSEKLMEGLRHFFILAKALSEAQLTYAQTKHRLNVIKIHFIDFPYCHRKECLSMD